MATRRRGSPSSSTQVAATGLDPKDLLLALQRVRQGDFSARLRSDLTGLDGKIADTFNDIVAANLKLANELRRVGVVVGKEGRTRQRVSLDSSAGAWGEMEVSINTLMDDLLRPTTEATGAIAADAAKSMSRAPGNVIPSCNHACA